LISLGGLANEEFPLLRNILITAKAYVKDETRSIVKLTLANAGIAWRFTVYCGCFKKGWGGPKFSYRDLRHDEISLVSLGIQMNLDFWERRKPVLPEDL
jgi:hypothetical protein